ncbi:uncharacterized protein LOC141784307 [Halichoeres trimaculatus]|uniref:uncharacterized protein LOC141784307 n=1 Tax=Halichoeres trimaculatus TaxID=147232 RepID=UPI003D9FA85C
MSTPGGECQEADVVNGEHQNSGESDEVWESIKADAKGRQEGADTEYYRVEKRVRGDFKAALEVNSGADKVQTKKLLTKWDLVLNSTRDDVEVGSSMKKMVKDDQVLERGSSSRYESQQRRALMTKPEGETDERSSDDQERVTHPVQKVKEKGDSQSDRDSSASTPSAQTETEGEVEKTQARAESEATVEENQSSDKSGTCIVRIYEDEKRITPSVIVRSTEKMDIKLKTLQNLLNREGSLEENMRKGENSVTVSGEFFQFPPSLEQNKKIKLDVRTLLANFSQENMFEIRCQSPALQNNVTLHETRV